MKKIIYAITALVLSLAAYSCNSSDEPSNPSVPNDVCYDFVTFENTSSSGTRFTLSKNNSSDIITYSCTYELKDSTLYPGKRLIIMYKPANGTPYTNGMITLYGYANMLNDPQTLTYADEAVQNNYVRYTYNTLTLTRTGNYVNAQLDLYCNSPQQPKMLVLAVDSTKLDEEYPELTLAYEPKTDGFNSYQAYASWNMAEVWEKSTCKGVKVKVRTVNGYNEITFDKGQAGFLPAD